jgi:hypothetical protein
MKPSRDRIRCLGKVLGGWLLAAACVAASASPQPLEIDLAGIPFHGELGSPDNVTMTFSVAPGSVVNEIGFALVLETFGASWLSEASILVTDSAGNGVSLAPALGADDPGLGTFSGSIVLADQGLSFAVLDDGVLKLQFYDAFDDMPASMDARIVSGTLSFIGVTRVPEPSVLLLAALGLAGMRLPTRRARSRSPVLLAA